MHQKPDQMEETRWEGQNFSEVVVPQEEKEEEWGHENPVIHELLQYYMNVGETGI